MKRIGLLAVIVMLLASLSASAVLVEDVRVKARGPREIDPESVLAYVSLTKGSDFTHQAVSQDVKNLQKSNRFSFVDVVWERTAGGLILTYEVTEKPRVRKIRVTGSSVFGNPKLRELLELNVGDFVDDSELGTTARRIQEEYRKKLYPFATMKWDIVEDPATGLADVNIFIDEGDCAGIGLVEFEGNTVFTAKELRKGMKQKKRTLLSLINGSGVYDPGELAMDLGSLKQMYLDKGYLDARIGTPQISQGKKNQIVITIPIFEGQQYYTGSITLTGVSIFPENQVFEQINLEPGVPADAGAIRAASGRVQDYYGRRGYIGTRVDVQQAANPITGVSDLVFSVNEGVLAYIRDIQITGNTRTKDKVIRRELSVVPGAVMDTVKIRTSESRLRNLGFFSFVGSDYATTDERGYYDLTFDVEEKRTGQFMVGAGFSSIDSLVGFVELGQGNFDLLGWPNFTGGGQKAKIRATLGTERKDYELSFTEPWFLDRKLSLGINLFQNESEYYSDDYDQKNTGGDISLTKPLTSFDRLIFVYSLQEVDVFNIADDASDLIKAEEGAKTQSSFGIDLLHDTRNNPFVPTRGNRTRTGFSVSGGPLGADIDMYKLTLKTSQYWPLWMGHVLSFRGETSVVDSYGDSDEVRIFDRLFLGGARTLRGFDYREVGPVDNAENQEPIGGNTLLFGSLEYEIPIWSKVRFAVFYDIGMVYEDAYSIDGLESTGDYNSDYGIGLRLDIPGFPLRLDYAWPMETGEYNDSSGKFSFMIGYVL